MEPGGRTAGRSSGSFGGGGNRLPCEGRSVPVATPLASIRLFGGDDWKARLRSRGVFVQGRRWVRMVPETGDDSFPLWGRTPGMDAPEIERPDPACLILDAMDGARLPIAHIEVVGDHS